MWSLEDLRAVDAVMMEGNFTGASRRLGVTRSTISKAVRRLEDSLEVQLFVRNTHEVRATDVGRAFYATAMRALAAAEDATALVRERTGSAMGTVRISLPTSLGFAFLTDRLPELLAQQPDLHVDVSMTDRTVDLVAEGFDVVLRIAATGDMPDSDLVARKLATGRMRLCASPAWVEQNGPPAQVSDLAALPCIGFSHNLGSDRMVSWPITDADGNAETPVSGPMRADSGLALSAAVLGGVGIGLLPGFLVSRPQADGRLVHLLPRAATGTYDVYALRPPSAYPPRAVTTVIDALQSWLVDVET